MAEDQLTKNQGAQVADSNFFRDIDVAFLVHELKDPIAVIETALRMLLEKQDKYGALTARQQRTLDRALRNSKKARSLLADLLEVGRSDAGCFQCCHFSVTGLVDRVLLESLEFADAGLWEKLQPLDSAGQRESVLEQGGIRIICSETARHAQLCQDEAKFRQILGNLIKNGLRHRRRRLEIDVDCRAGSLRVDVIDDGPGVEKENRELIFERYTRLKECASLSRTGHGLGLAGARILARRLGGDIVVRGHREPGAAFCLTLPLNLEQPR
jgi:signal transduction histidine kinase